MAACSSPAHGPRTSLDTVSSSLTSLARGDTSHLSRTISARPKYDGTLLQLRWRTSSANALWSVRSRKMKVDVFSQESTRMRTMTTMTCGCRCRNLPEPLFSRISLRTISTADLPFPSILSELREQSTTQHYLACVTIQGKSVADVSLQKKSVSSGSPCLTAYFEKPIQCERARRIFQRSRYM